MLLQASDETLFSNLSFDSSVPFHSVSASFDRSDSYRRRLLTIKTFAKGTDLIIGSKRQNACRLYGNGICSTTSSFATASNTAINSNLRSYELETASSLFL